MPRSALEKRLISDGLKPTGPVRSLTALLAEHREMVVALRQWACGSCGGSGSYLNRSRARGAEETPCKVCGASGLHPTARAVLEKVCRP